MIARRKFHDRLTVVYQQAIWKDNQATSGLFAAIPYCVLNVRRVADRSHANRDLLSVSGCSNNLHKLCGILVGRICYERHMRNHGIELY